MKKLVSCIIATLMLLSSAFAYTGLMTGEEKLRVTKTKWFDIIYSENCEKSAALLYENADNIYEEIGQQYGFPPKFRLPVVICSKVEVYNGYMATGPYNHIVLYDTSMIEDLAVFDETFLNLFRHECIHAYTFNLKNAFWETVSRIFGDPLGLAGWFISSGMAESATVSGESAAGEGRLNDEYAKQMVKQAKIEGNFPDYWDAQGSADIYPRGSFYYFNGAFAEWLQRTYGMDKYAMFWYKCVNVQALTTGKAFKKVYGMSIRAAWKLFEEEYPVPQVASNPIYGGNAKDFFIPGVAAPYSSRNNEGALFSHLTISDKGIAYMDETSSKVFYVPFEELSKDEIKPKLLFKDFMLAGIKYSKDGRFIATSCYDYTGSNERFVTKIYDTETGKTFNVKDHGFYEPAVIKAAGDYFLVRQGFKASCYYTVVEKILFDEKGNISGLTQTAKYDFNLNVTPFNYTDLGDGTFAYIKKAGLDYSIEVLDMNLNVLASYESPKNRMVIRYLSYDNGKLVFSWTAPNTMPRLGSLTLADGTFQLQEEDVSGGVYYPIAIPDSDEVAYIGNFYRENRLFTSTPELTDVYTKDSVISPEDDVEEAEETEETAEIEAAPVAQSSTSTPLQYEDYNQFKYYTKGYWMPLSVLTTTSYTPDYTVQYPMQVGVTYMTSNPWDADSIQLSAGWSHVAATGGIGLTYSSNDGPGTLGYSLGGTTEFNPNGWKKVTGSGDIRKQYPLLNGWLLGEVLTEVNFGKADQIASTPDISETTVQEDLINLFTPGAAVSANKSNYLYWSSGILFGYSHITRSGPGKYEKAGAALTGTFYHTYFSDTTAHELYYNGVDLQINCTVEIPKLLPIRCPFGVSYNLPSKLNIRVFPSSLAFGLDPNANYSWVTKAFHTNNALVTSRFDTLIFGADIQKATFIRWLYLKDLQITASYAGIVADKDPSYVDARFTKLGMYADKAKNGELKYDDYACLRTTLSFSPNVGRTNSLLDNRALFVEVGITGLAGASNITLPISFGLTAAMF